MRRDRLTFALMIGVPLIQLTLFGFAINADPKSLPTAVVSDEATVFSRSLIAALKNSGYFRITERPASVSEARRMLELGDVQFAVWVPADFSRRLVRGGKPASVLEADASDPAATSNALAALSTLTETALRADLRGPLSDLRAQSPPFEIRLHRRFNPEGVTQYNIVPGLMGVILTMTMIMMTGLAVTREVERGTMENLLATPVLP